MITWYAGAANFKNCEIELKSGLVYYISDPFSSKTKQIGKI